MEGFEWVGKMLILGGVMMIVVGGLIWLLARFPGLSEFPGTIRIERPGFTCIVPVLGSILLSILLTVVLNIIARLLNK
ncbi:MAG TPA: DUF2905 domain-containing protein [Anaerolineales bacterium]|nr:DUF2905 domain-containing protein [Anaerolineae bacterium]HIP87922.1 DUF2905 domain-containing protein [Anaerolineales bacterium]